MQDPKSHSSWSASPIHLSMEQNTAFVNSNVWVVRSIACINGEHLSYALVCSNCNKLVITWPLGCLDDLSSLGDKSASALVAMYNCYRIYCSELMALELVRSP